MHLHSKSSPYQIWGEGRVTERDEMILNNRGLVMMVANKYRSLAGKTFDLDDLIQVGFMGLIKAVDNFDHSRGVKFSTYAVLIIKAEISDFLENKSRMIRIPRNLHYLICNIAKYGDKDLTVAEIATKYNCSHFTAQQAKLLIERNDAISLDRCVSSDDESIALIDTVGRHDDFSSVIVDDFFNYLNEREKKFLSGKLEEKTIKEIENEIGVGRTTVYAIREKVVQKLEKYMA